MNHKVSSKLTYANGCYVATFKAIIIYLRKYSMYVSSFYMTIYSRHNQIIPNQVSDLDLLYFRLGKMQGLMAIVNPSVKQTIYQKQL